LVGARRKLDAVPGGGDGDRLRCLVDAHGRTVEALLSALERDASIREELWADVFGLAYQRLDDLEELETVKVRGWLLRTARNLTANAARRAQSRRRMLETWSREPIAAAASAEDEFFGVAAAPVADAARIRSAWVTLDEGHRAVLRLDALGFKGPRIAEELGVSHQAARSRLMRARAAFLQAYSTPCGQLEPGTESR
jgi:DNA-directed RNA polymerase specialized sigma24 family protein